MNTQGKSIYYLGLSSNIGDRFQNLQTAIEEISLESKIIKISEIYETEPVGYSEQSDFLNIAIKIESPDSPRELIIKLLSIEHKMGRIREIKNGPRNIDIDILLWEEKTLKTSELEIPHKHLQKRNFVLEPLKDIAKDYRHPILKETIYTLWENLINRDKAQIWTKKKFKI